MTGWVFLLVVAMSAGGSVCAADDTLKFSGYEWRVKSGGKEVEIIIKRFTFTPTHP